MIIILLLIILLILIKLMIKLINIRIFNIFALFKYWISLTCLLVLIIMIEYILIIYLIICLWKLHPNVFIHILLFLYDMFLIKLNVLFHFIVWVLNYLGWTHLFLHKMNRILIIIFMLVFGFGERVRRTKRKTTTFWTYRIFWWKVLLSLSVRDIIQVFTEV